MSKAMSNFENLRPEAHGDSHRPVGIPVSSHKLPG
jgi:hypothetical protein